MAPGRHFTWLSDIQQGAGVRVLPVLLRDGAATLTHDKLHRHPAKKRKTKSIATVWFVWFFASSFFFFAFFSLLVFKRARTRARCVECVCV